MYHLNTAQLPTPRTTPIVTKAIETTILRQQCHQGGALGWQDTTIRIVECFMVADDFRSSHGLKGVATYFGFAANGAVAPECCFAALWVNLCSI